VGKINVYDKIMIENQKKEKIWKSKKFLDKYPLNTRSVNGLGMNSPLDKAS